MFASFCLFAGMGSPPEVPEILGGTFAGRIRQTLNPFEILGNNCLQDSTSDTVLGCELNVNLTSLSLL